MNKQFMEFNYPIDYSLYNALEIATIINFLDIIEECYTKGVLLDKYKINYKKFKLVVKAKSEENNIYKNFKDITGYDGYLTTKEMKKGKSIIKI